MNSFIVLTPEEVEEFMSRLFDSLLNKISNPMVPVQNTNSEDELVTRREAADLLKMRSLVTIDKLAKNGLLKKHRLGTVVRFKKSEVLAFAQSQSKNKKTKP
jgi:excisionase family DNA binding protein